MQNTPTACPSLFSALDWYANHTLIRTLPEQIIKLQSVPPVVLNLSPELPSETVGLVCQGLSCQEPARSVEELQQQITTSQQRSLHHPLC